MPTPTDICNIALGKLGGGGDVVTGTGFIASIDGTDKVSAWCKIAFPRARRKTIIDLASHKTPFRETIRFADLGAEVSSTPEIGNWTYAFNLPGQCLAVIRQFDEDNIATRFQPAGYMAAGAAVNYQWETIADVDGVTTILVTDTLSNTAGTSAFIEYAVDITHPNAFSEGMIECIATLLAHGVAPVVGRDMEAAAFMLQQYNDVAVPSAKRANQMGFNNSARSIDDFAGGRSSSLRSL